MAYGLRSSNTKMEYKDDQFLWHLQISVQIKEKYSCSTKQGSLGCSFWLSITTFGCSYFEVRFGYRFMVVRRTTTSLSISIVNVSKENSGNQE